jgi:Ca-activated chloride channel homolog
MMIAFVSFGTDVYFALLAIAAMAGIVIARWVWWRRRARAEFGGLPRENVRGEARALVVPALLLVALVMAIFAAARPQWGTRDAAAEQRGIDIAFVLDVSNSMMATDAEPSRLGRSQAELAALLERLRGDRAALVIFAGEPFTRVPLTSDLGALRQVVDGVDGERGIVKPGSNLAAAIIAARESLRRGSAESQAIVIITDGEDRATGATTAIEQARAAGIRIYTAGAGTTEGASVIDIDRFTGATLPRTGDDGAPVITRLNDESLREIATLGGGRYIALEGDGRPLATLSSEFEAMAESVFVSEDTSTPLERFQIPAAIALALLAAAALAPMIAGRAGEGARIGRLWPLAAGGLFVAALCSTSVA